jgi:hypothetical protein
MTAIQDHITLLIISMPSGHSINISHDKNGEWSIARSTADSQTFIREGHTFQQALDDDEAEAKTQE